MKANHDRKKEPKQRESEAEDAQERHQVGSLNGKHALSKLLAASGKFSSACVPLWRFRSICHPH